MGVQALRIRFHRQVPDDPASILKAVEELIQHMQSMSNDTVYMHTPPTLSKGTVNGVPVAYVECICSETE
ncbi:MAG: hypothetical protein ACLPZ0_10275 [Steroidobacteraceae bacterium]|jgi:hypothetical protein